MFASISAVLDWYNQYEWVKIATVPFAALVGLTLANYLNSANRKIALFYGLSWVAIGLVLDAAITMRFNAEIFQDPYLWAGYAVLLLAPLCPVCKKS